MELNMEDAVGSAPLLVSRAATLHCRRTLNGRIRSVGYLLVGEVDTDERRSQAGSRCDGGEVAVRGRRVAIRLAVQSCCPDLRTDRLSSR